MSSLYYLQDPHLVYPLYLSDQRQSLSLYFSRDGQIIDKRAGAGAVIYEVEVEVETVVVIWSHRLRIEEEWGSMQGIIMHCPNVFLPASTVVVVVAACQAFAESLPGHTDTVLLKV